MLKTAVVEIVTLGSPATIVIFPAIAVLQLGTAVGPVALDHLHVLEFQLALEMVLK